MTLKDLDLNGSYTYADYLTWQIAERIELIKGKIWKMSPAPSSRHQVISGTLFGFLWQHFRKSPCQVFTAPFDITFTKEEEKKQAKTVLQPDISIICDPNKIDKRGCNGAPDLVVEILSPGNSRREMRHKYEIYEEYGVQEYWVVRPYEENVQIFSLVDGKFIGRQPVYKEQQLTSYIFPDFTIDLEEVFSRT